MGQADTFNFPWAEVDLVVNCFSGGHIVKRLFVSVLIALSVLSFGFNGGIAWSQPKKDLNQAAVEGDLDRVKALVGQGADVNSLNRMQMTPLVVAAMNSRTAVCKFLADNGADLNANDVRGMTALLYAVERNNKELVEFLVKKGADVNITTGRGENAFSLAKRKHNAGGNTEMVEIVDFLAKHGAKDPVVSDVYGDEYYGDEGMLPGGRGEAPSKQVAEIFKKVDELQERKKQRSTEYLSSLSDEKLAEIYTKHTRNEDPLFALESVKKDRPRVVRILLKQVVITPEDKKAFAAEFDKITEELTSLGPAAVPETIVYLRRPKSGPRRWVPNLQQRLLLWENALLRMGPGVVEPLIALMDDESIFLREKVAFVLSRQADPRAKDVLLRGLDDKSRSVRSFAIDGLVRLGPEVVGQDKLAAILVSDLKDGTFYNSIRGLKQYGDESAIEPLRVIEQFDTDRNDDGLRRYAYEARLALNAILRRAGKPVTEVSREHYSTAVSHDELIAAAQCPDAVIRKVAIHQLSQYPDEKTALFLMERIKEEKNTEVLHSIRITLYWTIMISPENSSRRVAPPEVMQKVFDAELAAVDTIWTSNLLVSRDGKSAFSAVVDLEHLAEKIDTATGNANLILLAASHRKVPLENINRFKRAVRRNLQVKELKKFEDLMIACYHAIASIAGLPPETGKAWSPQEKLELQQQLAPLLDSPNPHIVLISCLGCIGDNRLSPRLIELLAHSGPSTRSLAAFALGEIGDPNALPALQHLAETDPYQQSEDVYPVRRSAKEAIKKIRGN